MMCMTLYAYILVASGIGLFVKKPVTKKPKDE
jgi:hypothetical protein